MAKFQGVDYFGIEELLTEEERMARDLARNFVENEVVPIIEQHNREGTFPLHLIKKMGELGFFGANLTGCGLPGISNGAYGLIMQELERGDSSLRSFASVQGSLVMHSIWSFGTEVQKERWIQQLHRGEAVGCFGLTEPDVGSDPARVATKAVKDRDSYLLNGTKLWITNGSIADVAVVWAKLDGIIRGFLVERDTPGFSVHDIHGKLSFRASITSGLHFENCRIPAENLLPGTDGLKSALMCLNQARYGIAWGALGAAIACYETALRYAKERIQFGKPIASFQLVQKKLVFMLTEITKGQLLCLRLSRLKDAGRLRHTQVTMAKMNNAEKALEIARMARDILGAYGIVDEYPVFRHLSNLETVYTYEGTHDIHTLIIGRDITGLDAFA